MSRRLCKFLSSILVMTCFGTSLLHAQASSKQAPANFATQQTTPRRTIPSYFPPGVVRPEDEATASMIPLVLSWTGESPLPAHPADGDLVTYRLSWIGFPADNMIMVRLDVKTDGSGVLTAREREGSQKREIIQTVPAPAVARFLQLIGQPDFWLGPPNEGQPPHSYVLDGSRCALEGVGNNGQHAIFWVIPTRPYADVVRYLTDDLAHFGDFSH
jgi:hypothetical protein